MAVEALFRYLAEGRCLRPTVELTPHILMRSNLTRFMESLEQGDSVWSSASASSADTESL